jgi:hypothetical protein
MSHKKTLLLALLLGFLLEVPVVGQSLAPIARFRNIGTRAQQWNYVLRVLKKYRVDCRNDMTCELFAISMHTNAELAFRARKEIGPEGYAGDFVLYSFLVAAEDIEKNQDYWVDRLTEEELKKIVRKLQTEPGVFLVLAASVALAGEDAVAFWQEVLFFSFADKAGKDHFERHLGPAFGDYTLEQFGIVLRRAGTEDEQVAALLTSIGAIRVEHQNQFDRALVPAMNEMLSLVSTIRPFVTYSIPIQARELRESKIRLALAELMRQRRISQTVYSKVFELAMNPQLPRTIR